MLPQGCRGYWNGHIRSAPCRGSGGAGSGSPPKSRFIRCIFCQNFREGGWPAHRRPGRGVRPGQTSGPHTSARVWGRDGASASNLRMPAVAPGWSGRSIPPQRREGDLFVKEPGGKDAGRPSGPGMGSAPKTTIAWPPSVAGVMATAPG